MKNVFLVLFAFAISVAGTAQKKELKIAEKSLKKGNFDAALEELKVVDPLLSVADNKTKAKYYYVKAKSLYANGKDSLGDESVAGAALNKLIDFEKTIGKEKYSKEAKEIVFKMVTRNGNQGRKLYAAKDFKAASKKFELVYGLSPKDTAYLDNAALSAFLAKDYDNSISLYKKLIDLRYTGITTLYKGEDPETGKPIYLASQQDLDTRFRLKLIKNPQVTVTESRAGDIVKNLAYNYISKGDNDAALKAIADAKKEFPDDYNLIISEANIYQKLGDNKRFLEGLRKAVTLKPNDPNLHYNVGVLTFQEGYKDESIKHFEDAIKLKPDYADAYQNIAAAISSRTGPIIEEMNKNLSNFKKYDELDAKQKAVYREALPYYEKAYKYKKESGSDTEELKKTLSNLYELLEMYDKQKAIRAE